jgi:DNA (cytosine-5)-methyltransferase 1
MEDEIERLTAVDLFCGAGGMGLGFMDAGFNVLYAADNFDAAVGTCSKNLRREVVCADISKLTELPRANVFIGGPPCQGFSSAGLRRPDDERNSLVGVFAKLVAQYRPQAFVFENVEGFLTAGDGKRVFDLLLELVEAGYRIHLRKINAANYSVPQHRKRVIAIGGLGWDPSFPPPSHRAYGAPGAYIECGDLPPTPALLSALKGLPEPTCEPPGSPQGHYYRSLHGTDLERAKTLKPGQTMRDLPEVLWHVSYHRRAFRRVMDGTPTERRGGAPAGMRRLKPDEPCKAITSFAVNEFLHPEEDRFLTLRECARLQTFPDTFQFDGTPPEQALLIANAVPPLLAYVIADNLRRDLMAINRHWSSWAERPGALLSFVPTLANGMSPALRRTVDLVETTFGRSREFGQQIPLWD